MSTEKSTETYQVWIYLSGDINIIKHTCREFVMQGLCVTVEPVDFIYTGGEEKGAKIGLINYPRFPSTPAQAWDKAMKLALLLRERTFQLSVLIMDNFQTYWISDKYQEKYYE